MSDEKEHPIRCYLDGVEIDRLDPSLPFLSRDDWISPVLKWYTVHHFDKSMYVVRASEPINSNVIEFHIGKYPDQVPKGAVVVGHAVKAKPDLN